MDDDPRYRTLIETPEYAAQLESFAQKYSDEVLEGAIMGLLWGIATTPERYDKVSGNIWMARSRSFSEEYPSFKIIFGIPNQNDVLLMWIEEIGGIEEIGLT
jgi:hypothetical protein